MVFCCCFISFSKASNWCHRIFQVYTFIDSGTFDRIDRSTYCQLISILNFMLWIFVRQLLNCLPALGIPMRHRPIHFSKTKIGWLKQYLLGPSTESSSDSRESLYIYRTNKKLPSSEMCSMNIEFKCSLEIETEWIDIVSFEWEKEIENHFKYIGYVNAIRRSWKLVGYTSIN